jgi:thioredoxin 1
MAGNPHIVEATDATFESEVLKHPGVAIIDFWAAWCGPCRMLAPTIDSLATEFAGKVKVVKMDVDANPKTPTQFHVRGIPTVLFFKNGQLVDQLVGNQSKDAFSSALNRHLS